MTRRLSLVSAVLLSAGALGSAAPAQAAPLGCGANVTTSVTVSADIGPCAGDGLVLTGSGITVNLGGHTIRGGAGAPGTTTDQVGIRAIDVTGVTITGGTVRDFNGGVVLSGGSANTITRMIVTHNVGPGNTTYGDGIYLNASNNNTIVANVVTDNGPDAGIELNNSSNHNHVAYNQVTGNAVVNPFGEGAGPEQLTSGISNDNGASFNIIDHNVTSENGLFGISLAGRDTTHDQALSNDVRNNGNFGINAGGDGHLVSGNVIDHNGYEQFRPPGSALNPGSDGGVVTCGTCFAPGDINTIQDNLITTNNGPGISMLFNGTQFLGGNGLFGFFPPEPYTAPRSNLVQRNVVRSNTGDGIYVDCDLVYDANFLATCMTDTPAHVGIRVLHNITSGNGGANAGRTAWDLHDGNANCDHNVWSGNTYQTFNPPCTTAP